MRVHFLHAVFLHQTFRLLPFRTGLRRQHPRHTPVPATNPEPASYMQSHCQRRLRRPQTRKPSRSELPRRFSFSHGVSGQRIRQGPPPSRTDLCVRVATIHDDPALRRRRRRPAACTRFPLSRTGRRASGIRRSVRASPLPRPHRTQVRKSSGKAVLRKKRECKERLYLGMRSGSSRNFRAGYSRNKHFRHRHTPLHALVYLHIRKIRQLAGERGQNFSGRHPGPRRGASRDTGVFAHPCC